jgi:threonine dehydrogenase-like Zn-dependent dehydrogenase
MKALIFENELKQVEIPESECQNNEALIKIKMAGICNTDIEILAGYMNFHGVIGHEFVGVVEEVAGDSSLIGKRVVGEINIGCGSCEYCLRGLQRHCPSRNVLGIFQKNGAFAEKITLPIQNLFPVPDTITDEEAVFIEPLAACIEIFEQIHILPGESVAVIGDGKLGLLIAIVFNQFGCRVSLIGKHRDKLAIAAKSGIEIHQSDKEFSTKFPIVVEASGNASGLVKALALIRPRGTIILKSTYHGEVSLDTSKIVIDEINVLGSRCGRFGPAIRLLEHKLIHLDELISGIVPFDDYIKAFELARQKNTLKVLLKF